MNKKILIIGLGITGLSCLNFFLKKKIIPFVMDKRKDRKLIKKIPLYVPYYLGSLNKNWILSSQLIILSPGISIFNHFILEAQKKNIEIIGDIELFARYNTTPLIAVTGTNGKSTVTNMIAHIMKKNNFRVSVGGNNGYPVMNLLSFKRDFYILEISSFQLETIKKLNIYIAIILNISQDHMDRYPLGIEQYRDFKLRIYKNANICIYNADDILCHPKKFYNGKKYITFGKILGKYNLSFDKEQVYLKINNKKIFNFNKTKLVGIHNYLNSLAVLAVIDILKISKKNFFKEINNYKNMDHTLQIIHKENGVIWINDSKSTNVNSTKAALEYLHKKKRIWLFLGGYDKHCNLYLLQKYLQKKDNIKIICFGKSSKKILSIDSRAIIVKTIYEGIKKIIKLIKFGDIVLLSPACSSIDQFKNFKHRGNEFIKLVKKIHKCNNFIKKL
ncbi:UDP-N-acetylmuramoyl-L-alanine--D-glutamate ligase [Enterobacteriaceae endosymbiont of Donacia cincticornis]|uniref:UDP-N-acetylmuramoyl-L-alanine--D-glutamate ligase n=1 Tax=Enterobacteriaceae endosymbiont of Donacia cincticornis TaxID=2675773 RepID=UPI0014491E81|nr:UDP-N-acetylmuramoyl-L-alanine--D-glutamate ligase [Enterobacteriaceae endosymbiont of Donacia cincticornis]QJC36035.1 UDP-N-acetylmuramoyl-L-alanine--D-glutamate ligase [Enterobacteriaceae endosymbiont of Donacia cincticornis]